MECEVARAHLADVFAGTPAAVDAELSAHLRVCRACARELDELRDTWQRLGDVPADRPDSSNMRARFAAVLRHAQDAVLRRAQDDRGQNGQPDPVPVDSLSDESASSNRAHVSWRLPQLAAQLGLAAALLLVGAVVGRHTLSRPAPDPEIAALRQEVRDVRQMLTLSLMQQQSASDRLKGVTWTGQLDQPGGEVVAALLDTLMHDPNVNVRLASIDALRPFAKRENVRRGAVEALPRQTSPLVQMALIDFVAEVAGRESTATLQSLSQDPMLDRIVRERAAWALKQVS